MSAAILICLPVAAAFAGPAVVTSQEAASDVLSNGFSRVALTERAADAWNVWASKDGIAYEVELDARTGAVVKQIALESDD